MPCILFFIIFQIIMREKPEIPPSAVAEAPPSEHSFTKSFKEMWNNKNFLILAASYAIIYSLMISLSGIVGNLLNPFGYTPAEISIMAGSSLFSGMIGALIVGWILDCSSLYRKTLISISAFCVITMSATLITLKFEGSFYCLLFSIASIGFICVSYFPAAISYGAELTFPM